MELWQQLMHGFATAGWVVPRIGGQRADQAFEQSAHRGRRGAMRILLG